jgi:hypothetical protein
MEIRFEIVKAARGGKRQYHKISKIEIEASENIYK